MASRSRQLASSAFVFWVTTTLTCTSQIGLIAITIGLATNNDSINRSIHRTAWVTAAANMVALTASLGAVCLYVRRTARTVYISLCAAFIILSALAALLTIYTLTWIWNYVRNLENPDSRYVFTQALSQAGFAVWSIAFLAQATLYTLVLWHRHWAIAPPTPQELTQQRPSPGRSGKRRLSDLTSLTPPSTATYATPASEPSSRKPSFQSLTPKSSFGHSVNSIVRPMTSKTKLLLRQSSFPGDSSSFHSRQDTSLEALRQDDGFETWDTSSVEAVNPEHVLPRAVRSRLETRLATIPGSRPVSPAHPLDGPFPDPAGDDVRLPESPAHSPVHSPSSESSSFNFGGPPQRPDSSSGQSHIHPLFRSESPGPAPRPSPGTIITASPYGGQVVNADDVVVPPRKLRSASSFRAESPSPLSPNRSRQNSFRSVHASQPTSSHGERSTTPGSIRPVTSPEPDERSE